MCEERKRIKVISKRITAKAAAFCTQKKLRNRFEEEKKDKRYSCTFSIETQTNKQKIELHLPFVFIQMLNSKRKRKSTVLRSDYKAAGI